MLKDNGRTPGKTPRTCFRCGSTHKDEDAYRNCFALRLIYKICKRKGHIMLICQSKHKFKQENFVTDPKISQEDFIPYVIRTNQDKADDQPTKLARGFNDIFVYGCVQYPSEIADYSSKVHYIEVQINGEIYQTIPNTAHHKSLISLEQVLLMSNINGLKPQNRRLS